MPTTRLQNKKVFDDEAQVLGNISPHEYSYTKVITTTSATGHGTHKRWIYNIEPSNSDPSSHDQSEKVVEPVTPKKGSSSSSSSSSINSWTSETRTLAEPQHQPDLSTTTGTPSPWIDNGNLLCAEPSSSPPPAPKIDRTYTTQLPWRAKRNTVIRYIVKTGETLNEGHIRCEPFILAALEGTDTSNKRRIATHFENDSELQRIVAQEIERQKKLPREKIEKKQKDDNDPFE